MLMQQQKYVMSGARISSDSKYRYKLWREWRGTHDPKHWRWFGEKDGAGQDLGEPLSVLFVMLNPSTADSDHDDATIRKCVSFAKQWCYERMEVANLFAYRATKPRSLFDAKAAGEDIIGWQNCECVQDLARDAGLIVCAWGANAYGHEFHVKEVRGWLDPKPQFCLGLTNDGFPRHPLYAPLNSPLKQMP